VYGTVREPEFAHISNLFVPSTVDACFRSGEAKLLAGMKDDDNKWNTEGHPHRVIPVSRKTLELFASLYDEVETPVLSARLPAIHALELVTGLEKFAAYPRRLRSLSGFLLSEMWHETNAVIDGTIRRETRFAETPGEWVVSGPHIGIANPFSKTPRAVCQQKSDYDPVDLLTIPEDYLPRANYSRACGEAIYSARLGRVPWGRTELETGSYRVFARKMLSLARERTLLAAILPPGTAHIDGCVSLAFEDLRDLTSFNAACSSIILDFLIKTTGKANFREDLAKQLPVIDNDGLRCRTLLLNCLITHYSDLWRGSYTPAFRADCWAKSDVRLSQARFSSLTPEWRWSTPLRTDYERRQALVEIDVLAAMGIGLTLDELRTIYRIQFPVLRQNEQDTWYDRNGRIVFTCSKGLPGVGFSRQEWEKIRDMKSGTVSREIEDDTLPGGPRKRVITYEAPFDRCDREEDYKTAWAEFEKRRTAAKVVEA